MGLPHALGRQGIAPLSERGERRGEQGMEVCSRGVTSPRVCARGSVPPISRASRANVNASPSSPAANTSPSPVRNRLFTTREGWRRAGEGGERDSPRPRLENAPPPFVPGGEHASAPCSGFARGASFAMALSISVPFYSASGIMQWFNIIRNRKDMPCRR